jgi:hypothetical protein
MAESTGVSLNNITLFCITNFNKRTYLILHIFRKVFIQNDFILIYLNFSQKNSTILLYSN